jgi:Glucodextranase, domain B/PASTA domain
MAVALAVSTAASLPGVPSKARSVALVAAVLSAGCGGGDPSEPVSISLVSPADGVVVHDDGVELRGRVRPADARVLVDGRAATIADGEFRGRVPLREGANVIDVAASAPGARTAWSALRVERKTLVSVPDLAGAARGEAVDRLEALGLRVEVEEGGGLLDRLLPGDWRVCETQPRAGAELRRGATVRVGVSKSC